MPTANNKMEKQIQTRQAKNFITANYETAAQTHKFEYCYRPTVSYSLPDSKHMHTID
jgi:hypothetical protein